ncbi:MAG: hypothetical protein AB8B91_04350 [Rubripirellula sp.]
MTTSDQPTSSNQHAPVLRTEFSHRFEEEKAEVIDYLIRWGKRDRSTAIDLEQFESCVLLKNSEQVVAHANVAFKSMMGGGAFLAGSRTDVLLSKRFRHVSQNTDDLIIGGVKSVELEHRCQDGFGREYDFRTYKRRLDELCDPDLCFVVIIRAIGIAAETSSSRRLSLSEQLVVFRGLDQVDQKICQMYYQGAPTKSIAAAVGLATRSVEVRRQKVMDTFGFDKPVEVVKLLTRLEEHELIRLQK